jgi:hypothetical protein
MVQQTTKCRTLAIGAGLLAIVMAGCSSSGSSGKAANGSVQTTTSVAGSTGSGSTAGSGSGTVSVDLVITGDKPATIKGSKGRCSLPSNSSSSSGYDFSGSDYPSLGPGGDFSVTGPQQATAGGQLAFKSSIKALISGSGFLATNGRGITVSADRKKVTINADIGGTSSSGTTVHELVKGTISCP